MDELEEIRKKKLEQLKKQYMNGGKNMEETWPDTPIHVDDETLDQVVNKYATVAVDCWAEWCAPCHMIAPVIGELASEMQGKIVFGKLNVDENQRTSMKHQIMSIPTLLVFKNASLVDRIVGAMPKETLRQKLAVYQ